MKLLNIGFGNLVSEEKIVAVVSPEAAPVKRMVREAQEAGRLIDASCGRKTRAVIVAESDHVILSALPPERLTAQSQPLEEEHDEP